MSGSLSTVLLPGMDGTGDLFAPYLRFHPEALPVGYPRDRALGYAELEDWLRPRLPADPFVLVAESFSGPLAVRLGADPPPGLRGLVLVATFVRNPSPLPAFLPLLSLPFRRPPPRWAIGWALAEDPLLVEAIEAALSSVEASVLARRAREILRVDASEALARCPLPVLQLRGRRDRLVGERSAREIERLSSSSRQILLDAPHLVLQSAPEQAAAHVRDFVRGLG